MGSCEASRKPLSTSCCTSHWCTCSGAPAPSLPKSRWSPGKGIGLELGLGLGLGGGRSGRGGLLHTQGCSLDTSVSPRIRGVAGQGRAITATERCDPVWARGMGREEKRPLRRRLMLKMRRGRHLW